jgi:hypothetical protein
MLRRDLVAFGVLYLVVAIILFAAKLALPLAVYLVVGGLVLVVAIIFERRGYRPPIDRAGGNWRPTGERFIDPTTGRLIEVRYNPSTGERDYVDIGPAR